MYHSGFQLFLPLTILSLGVTILLLSFYNIDKVKFFFVNDSDLKPKRVIVLS